MLTRPVINIRKEKNMVVVKYLTELGPYAPGQEQKFKMDYINRSVKRESPDWRFFCIESEETVPGFPDLLIVDGNSCYTSIEFKVSDEKGVITFKKSQPLFYKTNPMVRIGILAWDVPRKRLVRITPDEVVKNKSLRLNLKDAVG
jgi:hypothetical protein